MSHSYGITEYPNTFKRQGSFPLDKSNVFYSLVEATEYAESNKIAYEGQIISVVENDDVNAYILKKNDDVTKNFKLVNISTNNANNDIIDINDLINSKVGIWSVTKTTNDDAILDFDIWYGVDANSYKVFFNEELVSDKLLLSDEFVTHLENFVGGSIKVTLKFYNDDSEAFELNVQPIYKNETVVFGSLYLKNLQ